MIKRYCFQLNEPLPPGSAYRLYAALLERAPEGFAQRVHRPGFTPVSQHIHEDRWQISLLGETAVDALGPVLDALGSLDLRKTEQTVTFGGKTVHTVSSVEELLETPERERFRLRLRTPVAFKSDGQYQLLPTQRLILQSLISKWNGCFSDSCPIEDEGGGLEALAAGLRYRSVDLDSHQFPLKNTSIPGVTGVITGENLLSGFHRQLATALLEFANDAGIGIKTALGMGGVSVKQM